MNRVILLFVGFVLMGCGSDLSYEQQILNYNKLVSKADSLNTQRSYGNALAISDKALSITDTLSGAFYTKGVAHFGLNTFDEAVDDFSSAIDIEGDTSFCYKGRAVSYLQLLKKEKFFEDINIYITHHKNDADAYNSRSDYLANEEDYEEAISDLTNCIRLAPKNPSYYLKRGNIYAISGKNNLSVLDYEKYTFLNPNADNNEIYYKRALLNIEVKEYQKAIKDLSLLTHGYINYTKSFALVGDCYFEMKDYKNAVTNYSNYLSNNSKDYTILNKRAEAYSLLAQDKFANNDYIRAAGLKWGEANLLFNYGWILVFFVISLIMRYVLLKYISGKHEYDNKKIGKAYMYFIFTGIFGGHNIYLHSYYKYLMQIIFTVILFCFLSFAIVSYYDKIDLFLLTIQESSVLVIMLIVAASLWVFDFITLPYQVFLYNYNLRESINGNFASDRKSQLSKLQVELQNSHNNFKILKK